jgi:hypothetical protein
MLKQAFAGALALATIGSLSVSGKGIELTSAAAQDMVLSEAHIARLKSALHLTPTQLAHWRTLETTLRDAAARQQVQSDDGSSGLLQRVRAKVGSFALNAASLQRVAMASRPLIASLDDEQRRDGMNVVQEMGFSSLF